MVDFTFHTSESAPQDSRPLLDKAESNFGFLPNIPEAVLAMLATASIGASWSSCSPDFGIGGVLDRFGQIEP